MSIGRTPTITRRRGWRISLAVGALLTLCVLVSLSLGPSGVHEGLTSVLRVLIFHLMHPFQSSWPRPDATVDAIVWQWRAPRAIAAVAIGALLAYAGTALQGLLGNPLADPYTTGVSSGAAVGAATAELAGFSSRFGGYGAAFTAFAGALLTISLVLTLSKTRGRIPGSTFLLVGVVVGSCIWSIIPLALVISGRTEEMQRILFYLLGSLQMVDWTRVLILLPWCALTGILMRVWARDLNLMTQGEETAINLGLDVEQFKRRVIIAASLATAVAVTVGGIIGFVGLVVPHIARKWAGPDHRFLPHIAALLGGIMLLVADTITRTALADGVPVGVITAVLGAPFFCAIVRRRQHQLDSA